MSEGRAGSAEARRAWPRLLIAALVGLVLSQSAWALRCGNNLVSENDPSVKLLQYCGQPINIEKHKERRAVSVYDRRLNDYVTEYQSVPYEIWTYNFGPNRFMMRITVRDGLITRIESAGYGF